MDGDSLLAQNAQINLFLIKLKESIEKGNFAVIRREKNNEFLAREGMTPEERENVILGLQTKDYESGPEKDYDNPNEKDIWKFKRKYLGKDIYIKLKLITKGHGFYAKCLSFHD